MTTLYEVMFSITVNKDGKSFYNRCYHLDEKNVIRIISNMYNVTERQVVLSSSGMEAFSILLECIMISNQFQKINLFYSDELYCDCPRLINYFKDIFGVLNIIKFDVSNMSKMDEMLLGTYKNEVNIVMMESCSNPTGKIFDFERIQFYKENTRNTKFIVDNTWMTHVCFNPFDYNVDYVFCSSSKHYSGGNCIGGFIIGPENFMNNLANFKVITGKHISLPYCKILLKNLNQMDFRITTTFEKTFKMAKYMEEEPKIMNVNYPLLQSNMSNKLALKYFKYGPNMLSFVVSSSKNNAIKWMKSFKTIKYKTSFGSDEIKFDCWPVVLDKNVIRIRLSVGFETNIDNVISEFKTKLLDL